jgi:putative phage-type endonuclease
MTIHHYTDEASWHDLRGRHVGASEVAALFNLSPWMTRWQLYMEKRYILTGGKEGLPREEGDTQMRQGQHFEPAIASYAAEKFKTKYVKVTRYLSDDEAPGMGASLDFETETDPPIPIEIKWSLYGQDWEWEGDAITQAPDYYIMQCQQQMACCGATEAHLIAFTGGDVRRMVIRRSEPIIAAIRDAVRAFWDDVSAGREPPPDFSLDGEAIARLAKVRPMARVELTAEDAAILHRYVGAHEAEKAATEAKDAAKAEITKRLLDLAAEMGVTEDAAKVEAVTGPFKVTASMIQGTPGTLITAEMVGERYGTRNPYRRITVSTPKDRRGM